ncbi:MAG: hypothetical protein U0174_19535 [Polyangiaceae bacterium]
MLKHIVVLVSLASVATLFGCASEVAPSEEEATTSGESSLESADPPSDPQEAEGAKCGCKAFCDLCAQAAGGQCVCRWSRISGCHRDCWVRSGDTIRPL